MYSKWQSAIKYLQYYFTASNSKGHGIHSPFIFHFVTKILADKHHYDEYDKVEVLRQELLNDHSKITVEDLGAGSSIKAGGQRTIQSITKNSAKPASFGQLLFRMVKAYQPLTILELGTSLGITTSYLSLGAPGSVIKTIEGAVDVAKKAKENFEHLGIKNISVIEGNFNDKLVPVINGFSGLDFCFIDGNHLRDPTIRYFHELMLKVHSSSVLVFDDIHWSPEMEEAWKLIKSDPRVRCSVDLFSIGILFFRKEFRVKQDFIIRF